MVIFSTNIYIHILNLLPTLTHKLFIQNADFVQIILIRLI